MNGSCWHASTSSAIAPRYNAGTEVHYGKAMAVRSYLRSFFTLEAFSRNSHWLAYSNIKTNKKQKEKSPPFCTSSVTLQGIRSDQQWRPEREKKQEAEEGKQTGRCQSKAGEDGKTKQGGGRAMLPMHFTGGSLAQNRGLSYPRSHIRWRTTAHERKWGERTKHG
ncbi:hypothetical protein PoB_006284800 [Plakobranchus ocellatus]|uniref:Uncharacterized protein n=1 Tax=Plakobranchus ocellatus TaxID=259542 RepID=A0AAV4CWU5_9GAST|nr:hypothetical protein PoB_006284800 [Plakobranchus ocellatus]